MTSTSLSVPTLYRPSDLRADSVLVIKITDLINDAVYQSNFKIPSVAASSWGAVSHA